MQTMNRIAALLITVMGLAGLAVLGGCTPIVAGQMAQSGYDAARNALGGGTAATSASAAERQKKLQAVMNGIDIGQQVTPITTAMGEPPTEKTGNAYGYTCYEYPAVYSATEAAVIVAKSDKVVFYGNSDCKVEMQDANFKKEGKYGADSTLRVEPSTSASQTQSDSATTPASTTSGSESQPGASTPAYSPTSSGASTTSSGSSTSSGAAGSAPKPAGSAGQPEGGSPASEPQQKSAGASTSTN